MYKKFEKVSPLIGLILGFCFFVLFHGLAMLDSTNINWLLGGGDLSQHFLGWHFFRNEQWHFPLGFIKNLNYPIGTSLVYTDSLPLFAIFFKIFSPILPENFQYYGIWVLFCYMMQGYFSFILMRYFTKNIYLILIGVCFFLLSPVIAIRAGGHETLAAHWIIIASLVLYFCDNINKTKILWIVLSIVSILVHFYLYAMAMSIYLAFSIKQIKSVKNFIKELIFLFLILVVDIFIMWCVGYFVIDIGSSRGGGLGMYSIDLLSFALPNGTSYFLNPLKLPALSKWEGYNYFGLGLLLLLPYIGYLLSKKEGLKWLVSTLERHFVLLLSMVVLFLISISVEITFLNKPIYWLNYPEAINNLLSIVRASGRMFWPITYIVLLFCFAVVLKFQTTKKTLIIMSIFCIVQIIDFIPLYKPDSLVTRKFKDNYIKTYKNILKHINHIVFIPPSQKNDEYISFAYNAASNKKTLNIAYLARYNARKKVKYFKNITTEFFSGKLKKDNLYVVKKQYAKYLPKSNHFKYEAKGRYIFYWYNGQN